MPVLALPAFADNYVWMIVEAGSAVAVDPGDAEPVERALAERGLALRAILLTHHHADHVGGAAALAARHRCDVYAPDDERIPAPTHVVRDGDRVALPAVSREFLVLAIPGHTRTHIAFAGSGEVYCGDTLFGAGCGRLFEGTPAQMLDSLDRLVALPAQTRVHCGHEYTVANLAFARVADPGNDAVARRDDAARACRARGEPTLPSTLALERETNPFLRCDTPAVRAAAQRHAGRALGDRVDVFGVVRAWKDGFRVAA